MSQSEHKIVQYLGEAHESEIAQVSALQSQIAIAPHGSYRDGLEAHLAETHEHARLTRERLGELGEGRNALQVVVGLTGTLIGQVISLGKTPFDLLRGAAGEERVLGNAKHTCATEALEIATYAALERVAKQAGDQQTAKLAASIRADEERMLKRVIGEIPQLAEAVVEAKAEGERSGGATMNGAAGSAPDATRPDAKSSRTSPPRATTRTARKAQEGSDATTQAERRRPRADAVSVPEPWPGYDELTVAEIDAVLGEGDDRRAQEVLAYERAHKNRPEVVRSALVPARFSSPADN